MGVHSVPNDVYGVDGAAPEEGVEEVASVEGFWEVVVEGVPSHDSVSSTEVASSEEDSASASKVFGG